VPPSECYYNMEVIKGIGKNTWIQISRRFLSASLYHGVPLSNISQNFIIHYFYSNPVNRSQNFTFHISRQLECYLFTVRCFWSTAVNNYTTSYNVITFIYMECFFS